MRNRELKPNLDSRLRVLSRGNKRFPASRLGFFLPMKTTKAGMTPAKNRRVKPEIVAKLDQSIKAAAVHMAALEQRPLSMLVQCGLILLINHWKAEGERFQPSLYALDEPEQMAQIIPWEQLNHSNA